MLTDAYQDSDNSIPIRYRFDGKLFNLRRLQAKSKVQTEVLDEFLFADDMAKSAPTEEKMLDQVSDSCDTYDLTISIKKDWGSISASTWKALQGAYHHNEQASVAKLDAPSYWRPWGRGFNPRRGRPHSFVEIDHEIFSVVILPLPLIQEGQLSFSGERMCIILVNRLGD